MTTLIGIMPNVETSNITIPASVKAITGYQAAVVYETNTGNIVNPTFSATTSTTRGITVGQGQTLLDLGSVGAFQKVKITDGSNNSVGAVTPPTMTATGLSTLTMINFANNSQLQTIGPKAFLGCSNLKTVNLPDSTNTIGAQAFQNCTNLQTINLKGVSYIGDAAFNNAFIAPNSALATENPVSLDLTSAQYIGTGAFDSSVWTSTTNRAIGVQALPGENGATETQNLSKISAISFAKPLTTLSDYAFNGANYLLKSVDLSSCTSLASIGNNAFSNTTNLADVKFSPTIGKIGNRAFSGAPLANTLTFNTNTDLTIGTNAFDTQQLTTIDFSNVKGNITIGNSAFSGSNQNTSLTTLNLPAVPTDNTAIQQIVMIGQNAFANCTALKLPGQAADATTPYSLPANIGYLGQNAFSTTTLATIEKGYGYTPTFDITNEWNNVADGLFAGVTNGSTYFGPLKGNNNTSLTSVDLSNTNIQALNYGNVSDLGLTSTKTTIQGTFNGASNLKEITLPASCNQFGIAAFADSHATQYGAFSNCSSLQKLNFKNFDLSPTSDGANGTQTIQPGFDQITQQTWVQVANIMNALMYFGQQNITAVAPSGGAAGTPQDPINTEDQINAITYTVNTDAFTQDGTWVAKDRSSCAFNQFGGVHMDAILGITTNAFNYPINVYPAGSYEYSVEAAPSDPVGRAGETVTVNYPAGLGTSVSANFKNNNVASLSVTMVNGNDGSTLGFGSNNTNGPLMNGQLTGSNAISDANVVFNTAVKPNGTPVAENSTITLTENSTRPQSVWYTVSASGKTIDNGDITQQLYMPTTDESNNIFAISANKIPGATNTGLGGYGYGMGKASGSSSLGVNNNTYTTTTCGNTSGGSNSTNCGQPFAQLTTSLVTNNTTNKISISQNYLPLGITSAVKDAYFNHNGIIWHYHNGFAAQDNKGIFIEGYVNAYIGGSIQSQGNGIGGLADGVATNNSQTGLGISALNNDSAYLTAGVYNKGAGLTSVGGTGQFVAANINNASEHTVNNLNPTIGLFGGKVKKEATGSSLVSTTENYSDGRSNNGTGSVVSTNIVAPSNVTVTLTLVPGTNPIPSR